MSGNLADLVFAAGVVGCGGAGFPTHVKLAGKADCLIINGAECEPLLRTDRHLMLHEAPRLLKAAKLMADTVGASRCVVALKESYGAEIAALEATCEQCPGVEIALLTPFYPAGDEQAVVQLVTGAVVPAGGIPLDVGTVVSNVATALAVLDATEGIPLTHRTLTVTGAVQKPLVLRVPVGTAVAECVAAAGGLAEEGCRIVMGGPMMGKLVPSEAEADEVVTKTTSGIVVLPGDSPLVLMDGADVRHTLNRARSACIQCSYCTMQCPRYLLGHPLQPHRIMRKLGYSEDLAAMLEDEDVKQALICCECGICELHACPMGLLPRKVNVLLKQLYGQEGIRYPKVDREYTARDELPLRRIPTARMAARTGILPYYHREVQGCEEFTPKTLHIPLKQHIGAPAVPCVAPGDKVAAGQLIAACPKDALGANVHTGLAGRVVSVDTAVTIETGKGGRA